ncbi:MAG TPA: hypothetical protein VKR52_18825 [Terracidiphilus sp.]|nr:hypothetical protein [Terracidiphilus sp.]
MMASPSVASSGALLLGGDLSVHRLGYGTMRLVGEGAWESRATPKNVAAFCAAPSSSAST